MNVVDSSGWLEYFANGPNADFFAPTIEDTSNLIVPSITIFEVFKRVLQQRSESDALQVAALMQEGRVVNLDVSIALQAVRVSVDHQITARRQYYSGNRVGQQCCSLDARCGFRWLAWRALPRKGVTP